MDTATRYRIFTKSKHLTPGCTQLDITAADLAIVLDILEQHIPERTVWAFGSRVTGKARPYSDLDLVLVGNIPLTYAQMADLVEAFDQSDLPFKVDIVDWARTDERFKEIIRKTKIVLRAGGKRGVAAP